MEPGIQEGSLDDQLIQQELGALPEQEPTEEAPLPTEVL